MLAWLPIVGPIIQGILGIFTKKMDTDVQKLTVNRQNDLEEAKVSAQIIQTTNDDIALRLMRDIYCFPAVVHVAAVSWDTLIAETTWISHEWMWHVATYPASYAWYPTTVAVFLLGNIGLNMWSRR